MSDNRSLMESMFRPVLDEMLSPIMKRLSDTSTCFNDTNRDTAAALRDCNHTMRYLSSQLESLHNRFDTVEKTVKQLANKLELENKSESVQPLTTPCLPVLPPKKRESIKPLVLPVLLLGAIAGQSSNKTKKAESVMSHSIFPVQNGTSTRTSSNEVSNIVQTESDPSSERSKSQPKSDIADDVKLDKYVHCDKDALTVVVKTTTEYLANKKLTVYKAINEHAEPVMSAVSQKEVDRPEPFQLSEVQFTTLSEFSEMSDMSRQNSYLEDGEIVDDTITAENGTDRHVQANTDTLVVSIDNKPEHLSNRNKRLAISYGKTTATPKQARKRQHGQQQKTAATVPKRPMNYRDGRMF